MVIIHIYLLFLLDYYGCFGRAISDDYAIIQSEYLPCAFNAPLDRIHLQYLGPFGNHTPKDVMIYNNLTGMVTGHGDFAGRVNYIAKYAGDVGIEISPFHLSDKGIYHISIEFTDHSVLNCSAELLLAGKKLVKSFIVHYS